jgi:hypothetical protein
MDVEPIEHAAGAANVKGGVENGNNIVECKFESRLKFEPVSNVEELNAAALAWQNAFNADLIHRQDNRLKRPGMTPTARQDLWRRITPEQLRICPPIEHCRALLAGREESRPVSPKLSITFKHPAADRTRSYSVAGLDGVCVGDELSVRPLLFGHLAISISLPRFDGEDLVYRLEPEDLPDEFGQPATAPVIGQEYKAKAETAAAKAGKAMDALAYPDQDADKAREKQVAPFGGQLNAHSHLKEIAFPAFLPRRGTAMNLPDMVAIEVKPMNHVQIAAWCAKHVPGWDADKYRQMVAWYPEGVLEADIHQVADRFRGSLRLVAVAGA